METILRYVIIAAVGALASILANQSIAVFNDGLRPVLPEYLEKRMDRKALAATSFAIGFGLVIGYGLPTSIAASIILIHCILLTTDIIGTWCPDTKKGMIVSGVIGAVYGVALLFGLLAQGLTRIDGLRIDDVEPLLQLRQTGTPIGLRGLLVGGIVIGALGAVMDVTMGIASSLSEVHAANPELSRRELFRSGMNIGRDMVGTMTNTLILAFLGSGFTLILYLYSLGLSPRQLLSSAYVSLEVVSGVASSVGVILSIPLTALITAEVFTREKKSGKSA